MNQKLEDLISPYPSRDDPNMGMNQKLEDFINPYPSRDHPDIQSLLYAKKEIRELVPDPDPALGEYRVDPIFFNHQVAFQRIMSEYGSVLVESGTGSGKTGQIA